MLGKPYAGNPHVRFDEGAGAPRHSGRSALLYTTWNALNGMPYAGDPHMRFDEVEVASVPMPRRGSLLCTIKRLFLALAARRQDGGSPYGRAGAELG